MFKCVNGQAPSYLCDKFKQRNQVHDCNTRSNEDLDIPKFQTLTGHRTSSIEVQNYGMSLAETKSLTNLTRFKIELKTNLMMKHWY